MSVAIEIIPLKGMNGLAFGGSTADAKKKFGEPEETETLKDDVLNADSLVFHYWDLGFSLFFNKQANLKLTCIEVDNPGATLWDQAIFHMNEDQIIDLFRQNGYELSETEQHDWGEKRVSFDEALIDLYFENGRLISINFGLFPEEETYYYFPN